MSEVKRILIVNTFGIGDVLFSTPLIASLKEHYKGCKISFISNARTYELLIRNPNVESGFVYERDDWVKLWRDSKIEYFKTLLRFLLRIHKKRFDLAIDLSLSSGFSFLLMLCGIKRRVGYDYKKRGRFLTDKLPLSGYSDKHVVEYYLDIAKYLNITPEHKRIEISPNAEDISWAEGFLASNNISIQDLLVAVIPGGGASWGIEADKKRLEAVKFAKVADKLVEKFQAKVIIFGSKSESALCDKCQQLMQHKAINACAKTGLMQFAALLSKCRLVITNDGGPLHVAVALGIDTVSIFGPVDERVYGPYSAKGRHIVIKKDFNCRPCYKNFRMPQCKFERRCLNDIRSDDVFLLAEKILQGK